MRKALMILAVGMVVVSASVYFAMRNKGDFTPYGEKLALYINAATLYNCQDNDFNTEIKVPNGFTVEADTANVAYHFSRYAFYPNVSSIDADGQIVIEYTASVCAEGDTLPSKTDSVVRPDGNVVYSKSIRRQKMKFTYSLIYPLAYDASVARLKKEVREWKAFIPHRPKMKGVIETRRKRMKTYHSGFAIEQPPTFNPNSSLER